MVLALSDHDSSYTLLPLLVSGHKNFRKPCGTSFSSAGSGAHQLVIETERPQPAGRVTVSLPPRCKCLGA